MTIAMHRTIGITTVVTTMMAATTPARAGVLSVCAAVITIADDRNSVMPHIWSKILHMVYRYVNSDAV
jgi:hypothetical protein